MSKSIYFADLTHTANGYNAPTFPLGVGLVHAYTKKIFPREFAYKLFRFPEQLTKEIERNPPTVLAISNFSWNFQLGYAIASWAKGRDPNLVTIFGGPNFPFLKEEKEKFLKSFTNIDFYIELEGEKAFVQLIEKLADFEFETINLIESLPMISNTNYICGGTLISGDIERIRDINDIPSPYLTGIMDKFFDYKLEPMIETTRGCPFSCAFCADGLSVKNKIRRVDPCRVEEELNYIAGKVKESGKTESLLISDLNFGMYKEDLRTAKFIADHQKTDDWPTRIGSTAGKNKPERILQVLKELKNGSWSFGSGIQSSDEEVLGNVDRSNISVDSYNQLLQYANSVGNLAYTEIILSLPGDTQAKHFQSLRHSIENGANQIRMYQSILLPGTKMATKSIREKFEIRTKFRVIPGSIGFYQFGKERTPVCEIEEIIVSTKDMTFDEYVSCRVMNLFVEVFFNGSMFDELFNVLEASDIATFDVLENVFENQHKFPSRSKNIIDKFVDLTRDDLYDSHAAAKSYLLQEHVVQQHLENEAGINELLICRAELYLLFEEILDVLFWSSIDMLVEKNIYSEDIELFLDELKNFIYLKKSNFHILGGPDKVKKFSYDFESISRKNFDVDLYAIDTYRSGGEEYSITFHHLDWQKRYISNNLFLFDNTNAGLGRYLVKTNLRKAFRNIRSELM